MLFYLLGIITGLLVALIISPSALPETRKKLKERFSGKAHIIDINDPLDLDI